MKKLLVIIGLSTLLSVSVNAQSTNPVSVVKSFFANNPTNTWDITGYGLQNLDTTSFGAGARVGYWLTPSVGAALDASYCDSSWTFMSLGLAARGTVKLGDVGSVSPFITAGAGWNVKTPADLGDELKQTVVAVAGGGATLHFEKVKWFDFFGEYQYVSGIEGGNRILFGLTKRF